MTLRLHPAVHQSARIVQELSKRFKTRDLGPISLLLGIQIVRDRFNRRIILSRRQYILDMLELYGFSGGAPVKTPMEPELKLSEVDCPSTPDDDSCRRCLILMQLTHMYLANCTRLDIPYAVSLLACFNANPGKRHWQAVKYLLRYLRGTLDLQLSYEPAGSDEPLVTYSDAGDSDTLCYTGAYVVQEPWTGVASSKQWLLSQLLWQSSSQLTVLVET